MSRKELLRLQLGNGVNDYFAGNEDQQHHIAQFKEAINQQICLELKVTPEARSFRTLAV